MKTITIEVPESILSTLKGKTEDFANDIKLYAAMEMYREGKMSTGTAAEFLGISRIAFFKLLGKHKVPLYDVTKEELEKDIENASKYSII